MTKHWNDEMMVLEAKDNLTRSQNVGMEGWDLRWEVSRLSTLVKFREKETQDLRFELAKEQYAKATLIAELNAVRGRKQC
jgi:hypothetical protein